MYRPGFAVYITLGIEMENRSTFASNIKPHVSAELEAAAKAEACGSAAEAFVKLERAHVLGQASTVQHVRVHCHMLAWAWRQRSAKEFLGQVLRIAGAARKTAIGLVPTGKLAGFRTCKIVWHTGI